MTIWKENSILPHWFNNLIYWTTILLLAANGWFLFASLWFVIWTINCYADFLKNKKEE